MLTTLTEASRTVAAQHKGCKAWPLSSFDDCAALTSPTTKGAICAAVMLLTGHPSTCVSTSPALYGVREGGLPTCFQTNIRTYKAMHEGSRGPSHDPAQIYSTTKRLETPPMVLIHVVPCSLRLSMSPVCEFFYEPLCALRKRLIQHAIPCSHANSTSNLQIALLFGSVSRVAFMCCSESTHLLYSSVE